jgi:hypothetical protein
MVGRRTRRLPAVVPQRGSCLTTTRTQIAKLSTIVCLSWLGLSAPARADFEDQFPGTSLNAAWTTWDGYALQNPANTSHHAHFQVGSGRLSVNFPGVQEHNQWWLADARVLRAFPGSGTYEIKVDSALTGSQQFGIVFQKDSGTFLQFMFYSTDQVYAYIERFATVDGTLHKNTVAGTSLGLAVPAAGPYYLRVVLEDDPTPSQREWRFEWSQNNINWQVIFEGVYEGPGATENIGAIQQVGVFAGNQPPAFSGFDARFDFFRFTEAPPVSLEAPSNVVAQAGDGRVDLWWDQVEGAHDYAVYRSANGGAYSLLGTTTNTSFEHVPATNGVLYSYTVAARVPPTEGPLSEATAAKPHVLTDMVGVPTNGLELALSASELSYEYSNGQAVRQWPNAQGPLRAALASPGRAPTFIASGLNGKPVLRFDGADDFYSITQGFSNFTAGMSLYIVAKPTVLQSGFKLIALGNGPGQQNIVLGRAGSTSGMQFFTDSLTNGVSWFNTSDGLIAGEAAAFAVHQEAGAANTLSFAEVSKNGEPLFGQNVWVGPVLTRSVNLIGNSYWTEGLFQGDIAEVLVYNRLLNASEQSAVQNYLATKYDLGGPPPPPPPAAPANPSASGGNATVSLTWSAVSGVSGYKVYRSTTSGGSYTQIADRTTTNYTDNSVVNGTTYYYVVTAYNTLEESAYSTQVAATPSAPPPPPNPALPTAGLVLALDAGTLVGTVANGGSVLTWRDQSGLLNNATAGTGAPTFISSGIGGKPVVRFDGNNDYLTLPNGFSNFTSGISLYVIARPTVLQSGFKLLALGNGAGQQNIVLGRAGSTSGLQYFTDGAGGTTWFNTAAGLVANESALLSLVQDGGAANSIVSASVLKNGAVEGGQGVYVPPVTSRGVNYIGKSYWTEGIFQGDIAEVILYNRKLSAAEQASIYSYLETKYGVNLP